MTEPWVVTYQIEYMGEHRNIDVLCRTTIEFFRGAEAECLRIARHSASPGRWEGKKITSFSVIIGPAKEWDEFLREMTVDDDDNQGKP